MIGLLENSKGLCAMAVLVFAKRLIRMVPESSGGENDINGLA